MTAGPEPTVLSISPPQPESKTMKPDLRKPSPPPPSQDPTPTLITSTSTTRPPSPRPSMPSHLGISNMKLSIMDEFAHLKLIEKTLARDKW